MQKRIFHLATVTSLLAILSFPNLVLGGSTVLCAKGYIDWVELGKDAKHGNNTISFRINTTERTTSYGRTYSNKGDNRVFFIDRGLDADEQVGKLFYSMLSIAQLTRSIVQVGDNYGHKCDDISYVRLN